MHPTHGKVLRLKESLQWAGWFWSQWKWSRNVLTNYCSPKTSALQMMATAEQPPLPLPSSLKAGIQFFSLQNSFLSQALGTNWWHRQSLKNTLVSHTLCLLVFALASLSLTESPLTDTKKSCCTPCFKQTLVSTWPLLVPIKSEIRKA